MGKAEAVLYRSALKLVRAFKRSEIPFTGIYGAQLVNWSLDSDGSVREWCRGSHPEFSNLQVGAACLGLAEEQLKILENTEDETRQALRQWELACNIFVQHKAGRVSRESESSVFGCLLGMNTISEQIREIQDPLALNEASEVNVDTLLNETAKTVNSLMETKDSGSTKESQLQSFVEIIYKDMKFKYEPFEWLYEGLDPILVSHLLQRKKGTPASLALCLSALGGRVGLPLLPMPLLESSENTVSTHIQDSYLETLSPDAALKLRSKTQSVVPSPSSWFLRLDHSNQGEALYVDCKNGSILNYHDMIEKHPRLGQMSMAEWREQCVLRTWSGLVQLAIQAHQRRGESDLVSHWIFIKLCLDPLAPEWERAMSTPEV